MKKFFTFKNIIILLVILRLLAFASFYFNYPTEKISDIADTDHYWGLARSIHDDGSFINNEIVTVPEAITFNQPNAFRVPGYPLFLSAFWNFGEQGYTAVPAIQFIIALFCVYLLYLIAKKLFSEKVAQVTAVLFLIEPTFLAINYFVLADTLFILLFLAFIYQLILFFQQGQNKYLVSSSLFLSVGMLVRPVVMYVPIILVITFLFYYRKSFKTFLKKSALLLILVIIFVSPWLIRNYVNFNKVFLTTLQSYNSWRYYIGFWETGSFDVKEYWENAQEEFKQETGKEIVEFVDFADASNMDYYDQKVGEYIKGNFGRIVGVQLYRMALQTFDGRYFNYISEMYTGHTYTKGYSQMLASENKWQFIKSAPELFLGSLITFFIFLNSLVFFIYFFFKRHTLAIKKESVAPIIFLGLLIIYFHGTGAPGNTERYIMPILVIEYVFLAYMLVNFKNLFKKI